ncbi:MAG: DUF1854 domain-containing protein [Clostridia bacterium]|nr:DUF1854 domain-containing protein [Clostridia bacterium]
MKRERFFLTQDDIVEVCENNLVTLTHGCDVYEYLEPRSLFPVSHPDEYITFLDIDGDEVATLRRLDDLSPQSRRVVEMSLRDYYLVPHIKKIISYSETAGVMHWTVETDRGVCSFDIRSPQHDIRINKEGYCRLRDSDDNRYIIDNVYTLDRHSRGALISEL